jgi:hypothetical protein
MALRKQIFKPTATSTIMNSASNLIKKDFNQMNQIALEEESFNMMNETLRSQTDEDSKDYDRELKFKEISFVNNRKSNKDRPSSHPQDMQLRKIEYEETEIVIEEDEASFLKSGENKYKFTFSESDCPEESYNMNAVVLKEHQSESINSPGRMAIDTDRSVANRCSVFESGNKVNEQTLGEDYVNSNMSKIDEHSDAFSAYRPCMTGDSVLNETSKRVEYDGFNQTLEDKQFDDTRRKGSYEPNCENELSVS